MGHPPTRDEKSDQELIILYRDTGNNHYVGLLFKRYEQLILGTAIKYLKHREEAKDASMDIFEELLDKLLRHQVANFKSWLYSLTANHCLMKIRKRKGIIEEELQPEKIESAFMETPDFKHLDNEAQSETELLNTALSKLKDHQRICVELFYLKEMSYKEVADATGHELKKVKSYIQNGKRNLHLFLSEAIIPKS